MANLWKIDFRAVFDDSIVTNEIAHILFYPFCMCAYVYFCVFVAVVLVPVLLFAVMHAQSYTRTLVDVSSQPRTHAYSFQRAACALGLG